MPVVAVLSLVAAILSLTGSFRDLVLKSKILDMDKDGVIDKFGELLEKLGFVKDVDTVFDNFSGEQLAGWLSLVNKTDSIGTLAAYWQKLDERFETYIVDQIETQLARMEKIDLQRETVNSASIPRSVRKEVGQLTEVYPKLLKTIKSFTKKVRKQSQKIKGKHFDNLGRTAIQLNTEAKRVKRMANSVLRDMCSVAVAVYGQAFEKGGK